MRRATVAEGAIPAAGALAALLRAKTARQARTPNAVPCLPAVMVCAVLDATALPARAHLNAAARARAAGMAMLAKQSRCAAAPVLQDATVTLAGLFVVSASLVVGVLAKSLIVVSALPAATVSVNPRRPNVRARVLQAAGVQVAPQMQTAAQPVPGTLRYWWFNDITLYR